MASLLDQVIEQTPLTGHSGVSGHRLERVRLADGTRLVVKHMRRQSDWGMRATHDPDVRDALLWTSGVLARVPSMIDHTVVGVETEEDGWRIIMRDVSESLIPPKISISRANSRRILRAVAALHTAFYGTTVAGLCTLTDRYRLLSPAVAEVELSDPSPIPRLIRRGWEIFPELVPADVSDAVFAILAAPHLLADELQRHETTLIHGDLHLANVGLGADQVILLDWGLLTAIAPPAVEFAYYLVMRSHHAQIDASPEDLIEDFHASAPERFDVGALQLSLLGSLVMFGCTMALGCADGHEERSRAAARDRLDWWLDRAREALDWWAPGCEQPMSARPRAPAP